MIIEVKYSGSEFYIKQESLFSSYDECKDWFDNKGGYETASNRKPNFIREY